MSPRRIRVAGVSADFRVPRGWPTPTDGWVRSNVFWQPPPGWTPRPDLPRASLDWRFWVPNEQWKAMSASRYRSATRWLYTAGAVALLHLAVRAGLASAVLPDTATLALLPLALAAVACLVMFGLARRRATKHLLTELAVLAERKRAERLTREYQHYLLDGS